MKVFHTIESWASSVGYIVEKDDNGNKYFWHREDSVRFNSCHTVGEVIEAILDEIRRSYEGAR